MIDGAWFPGLLRTPHADSALLRASRKLADVAANDLTRDVVEVSSRGVQPTEEVREAQRVSALRVDRTVAQAQIR